MFRFLNGFPLHREDESSKSDGAPSLEVPNKKIVAVEHPFVVLDLDKGLNSFGPQVNYRRLVDDLKEPRALPLWFRPENPTANPIVSHHAATNNVLLKITVPKRTGRKRKRGSGEAFSGDASTSNPASRSRYATTVGSVSRQDAPTSIIHKMQDNPDKYKVEAVGMIRDSHRYRGLADFQFSTADSPFLTKVAEHMLPMNLSKMREFQLRPGVHTELGQEIIPPPQFSDKVVPFNYNYEQNPFIKQRGFDEEGGVRLVNIQGRKKVSYGWFIARDSPVPTKAQKPPEYITKIHVPDELMDQLHNAMEKRPIWTRRALVNQLHGSWTDTTMKVAIQLVGYQFRGGPWRDAIIKYGVDPRTDPKYRIYQTLAFQLSQNPVGMTRNNWYAIRREQISNASKNDNRNSHNWDGKTFSSDGKFWQVCDITDPFLVSLIEKAPLRDKVDLNESGFYQLGSWIKFKAVMRAKMVAIQKGKLGLESDEPQKKGFLYDSFLASKLKQYPDVTEKHFSISKEAILKPIDEIEGMPSKLGRPPREQSRRKPLPSQSTLHKTPENGVQRHTPKETGEELDGWAADGIVDDGDALDQDEDDAPFPDDAWEHVLDSDLDDLDIGDAEGNDGEEARDEV
ncbi:hypothetical protein F4778DRAFT_127272 [Xylariomycetidae sp. FL2044]|nr:hypothetical protein F4778DRAFT_127272 [Xylariomycetidae sp. FL2044]